MSTVFYANPYFHVLDAYNYEYYLDVERQSKIYPKTISLDEGLKESAEWYINNEKEVGKKTYFDFIDENLNSLHSDK